MNSANNTSVDHWVQIPDRLRGLLDYSLGCDATRWIEDAQNLAIDLANRWDFFPERVFTGGALSLVTLGTIRETGEKAVLKIPTNVTSGVHEGRFLSLLAGKPVPQIYSRDESTGAFLMQYLPPEPREVDLEALVELWRALGEISTTETQFLSVVDNFEMRAEWAHERFAEYDEPKYHQDIAVAIEIFEALIADTDESSILHGDFQNKNIYYSDKRLVVLDPLPCLGSRIYDLAFWLALTAEGDSIDSLVQKSANLAGIDYQHLLNWTWSIAVIENRPFQKVGAGRRQEFIDKLRNKVG
ncbi:MAG: aminoglycoside phosphotransferase family protein [Actinomycetaceae bacterium]|nr:aminoglycoside phosphotransferase family protein [Actinomycetaceae bacterium]